MPTQFPLEEGNAWVYNGKSYSDSGSYTEYTDTLYICGKYEDYFLYKWGPLGRYNLVMNEDDKLVQYGYIEDNELLIYEKPNIWFWFGKTGRLIESDFNGYQYNPEDTISMNIVREECLGYMLYGYVKETLNQNQYYNRSYSHLNEYGFYRWRYYDEERLGFEWELNLVLKNTYPEDRFDSLQIKKVIKNVKIDQRESSFDILRLINQRYY